MNQLEDHPLAQLFPLLPENELQELGDSIARNGQREPIVLFEGKILDGRNRYRGTQLAKTQPITRVFDPKRDGTSPLKFVLDGNLTRRHLTTSQRAAIAAESLKLLQAAAEQATASGPVKVGMPTGTDSFPGQVANGVEIGTQAPAQAIAADGTVVEEDDLDIKTKTPQPPAAGSGPTIAGVAAALSVSEASVKTATALGKDSPEKLAEVKAGTKTLNKATTEVQEDKKRAELKAKRGEALKAIKTACGEDFAKAVDRNTILKTVKELEAFLALTPEEMKAVQPLVSTGWKVKKALAHALNTITDKSTVADLINKAIASGGEEFTIVVNGWEITAMHLADGTGDGTPKA